MAKNFKQEPNFALTSNIKQNKEVDKPKSKVGRPKIKTEETKTINIAIPVSTLEKLNIAKKCYGNNLTQYINKLIERDIQINYDKYKNISDSLNNF